MHNTLWILSLKINQVFEPWETYHPMNIPVPGLPWQMTQLLDEVGLGHHQTSQ